MNIRAHKVINLLASIVLITALSLPVSALAYYVPQYNPYYDPTPYPSGSAYIPQYNPFYDPTPYNGSSGYFPQFNPYYDPNPYDSYTTGAYQATPNYSGRYTAQARSTQQPCPYAYGTYTPQQQSTFCYCYSAHQQYGYNGQQYQNPSTPYNPYIQQYGYPINQNPYNRNCPLW